MNLSDQTNIAAAVTASNAVEMDIPFNQLHVSRKNARTKPHTQRDIECRAASIKAYGILNRLQVINEPFVGTGQCFGVVAGGGRYLSIALLVEQGVLPEDWPVKCDLRSEDDAIAISLAENMNRAALHEADEFVAFKAMADEGKAVETIAAHFSIPVRTVQQRLRLGALHPDLINAYRNGEMGPQEVRAFCRSTDQERQLQVWQSLPAWSRSAHYISHHLSQDSMSTNSAMVAFVGLDAYRAAGGHVAADLFSDQTDEARVEDLALLHQLAVEKLQGIAAEVVASESWSWSDVCETYTHQHRSQFDQEHPTRREPSTEEQDKLSRLESERGALRATRSDLQARLTEAAGDDDADGYYDEEEDEEEGDAEGGAADALDPAAQALVDDLNRQINETDEAIEQRSVRIREIEQSLLSYSEEVRARAGVTVALYGRGSAQIVRGLIVRAESEAGTSGTTGNSGIASSGAPTKKERAELSERLSLQLSAHRTAIMQAAMINQPNVAIAAATHRMLEAVTRRHRYADSATMKITATFSTAALHDKAPDLKGMRASDEVQARIDAWRARVPSDTNAELAWLLSLSYADLNELFALCVALTLDATTGVAGAQPGQELATALQIDVASYWSATEGSYFGSVSKERIVAALDEACGLGAGEPVAKMKKGEAAKYAEQKLVGTGWLPAMMRTPVKLETLPAEQGIQDVPVEAQDHVTETEPVTTEPAETTE